MAYSGGHATIQEAGSSRTINSSNNGATGDDRQRGDNDTKVWVDRYSSTVPMDTEDLLGSQTLGTLDDISRLSQ